MKKLKVLIIGICLLFVCMLSSCSGYNSTMIKHLSDINNYSTYNVIINDISFFDDNSDIIYIDVIFSTKEEVAKFKGVSPENISSDAQDYIITVTVNGNNVTELYRNDFNKNVNIGDSITITVSNWIYMDTNYFYVIGIEMNDVIYLDTIVGLENVVQLMKNDKSVF